MLTTNIDDAVLIVPTSTERRRRAVVDIAIPTYNEAATLEGSVRRLH